MPVTDNQISDFYNHWKRTLLSSSLMFCESHTVETWTGTAGRLRIDVRSNHCYPKALTNISFLADGLNIFPQALATHLQYVTFRFIWQTLQTLLQFLPLLQLLSFWAGLFSLFPTSEAKDFTVIPEFCIAHSYCARCLRHQHAHMRAYKT